MACSTRSAASFFAQVAEHQDAAEDEGGGVGDSFAGDVGGAAVDGLEDGDVMADVGAGGYA